MAYLNFKMLHLRHLRYRLLIFMLTQLTSLVVSDAKPLVDGNYKTVCDENYQDIYSSAVLRGYQVQLLPPNQTPDAKYLLIEQAKNFTECVKQCCFNEFKCDVAFFNHSSSICMHIVCNVNSTGNEKMDNQSSNQQCPLLKKDNQQPTSIIRIRSPTSRSPDSPADYDHHNELSRKRLVQEFGFLEDQSRSPNLVLKSKYSSDSGPQQTTKPSNGILKVTVNENPILQLPNDSITISASVEPPNNQYAYKWTLVSKPDSPAQDTGWIGLNTDTLKLNKLVEGTYIFNITVTNKLLASGQATVNITVLSPKRVNKPPTAIIQPNNSTVQLPKKEIVLDGSQSIDDDRIVSYKWSQCKSPLGYDLQSNDLQTSTLQLKNLIPGLYVIELMVSDSDNQTSTAQAQLIVQPEKDYPPTSNAGPDQIIFLPQNSVTLYGESWEFSKFNLRSFNR